eukprot:TRINITY_DN26497_c0_g1_i1.p1 TRINITY_DN26497_c0_g1~~TRINITY_DN26497_c0_g1_i1.p1  ORF type:complete len:293 (-),score=31.35 TRINITY_DN26497_c0_g1_i1:117-959(-)
MPAMVEPSVARPKTSTVKFNVQGKLFELLREPTLSLYPSSLLAQRAKEWYGGEPIFVEANAGLFPYIVDYLRYRKIIIPSTVSKLAVMREAEVLGLKVEEVEIVQDFPTMRQVAQKADEGVRSLSNQKMSVLVDLIMNCALKTVVRREVRDTFSITDFDLAQMEGSVEERCGMAFPEVVACSSMGEYSCKRQWNPFDPVLAFLVDGERSKELEACLAPQAKVNGYSVKVMQCTSLSKGAVAGNLTSNSRASIHCRFTVLHGDIPAKGRKCGRFTVLHEDS